MIAVATARVRCSGRMHRISVMPNGRVRFHDHDAALWLTEDLGLLADLVPACRCADILREWRRGSRSDLPVALRAARVRCREIAGPPAASEPTLKKRLLQRVAREVATILEKGIYRQPSSRWAGGQVSYSVALGHPGIATHTADARSANNKWSGTDLEICVTTQKNWLGIHRAGYSTVADRSGREFLVLGTAELRYLKKLKPGTALVYAAKQGRGLEIYSALALIQPLERRLVRWVVRNDVTVAWKETDQ